jgi:vancomycin permeability regulator SanA
MRLIKWAAAVALVILLLPIVVVDWFGQWLIVLPTDLKPRPIAIVFGAAAWGKAPSPIFADRLQTAAELYFLGKAQKILISGDNSELRYNEPVVGQQFLLELGVPADDIALDYAGFRTYDTCARARAIFGIEQAILITQRFHLPRALFLCSLQGIDSVGIAADRRRYRDLERNWLREQAARYTAFWEGLVLRHDPTVLGEKEEIGE